MKPNNHKELVRELFLYRHWIEKDVLPPLLEAQKYILEAVAVIQKSPDTQFMLKNMNDLNKQAYVAGTQIGMEAIASIIDAYFQAAEATKQAEYAENNGEEMRRTYAPE